MDIDVVVTWVDGDDPEWLKVRNQYQSNKEDDVSKERYRAFDVFKYWFRGIEEYAPWVRYVHFVTYGHVPSWLDTSNPKLRIVRHEDYMPQEILPVFNSNTIEMYMHKIPDLAEHFVYFNDDMFLLKPTKPEDFFIDGKPVDMLALQPVIANPANPIMSHIYMNNSLLLSKYFNKNENIRKQRRNYYKLGYPLRYYAYNMLEYGFPQITGFYTVHGPSPFLKSTFETVWEKEKELLDTVSQNRFRGETDISQYVFREWQKLTGNFVAKNVHKRLGYFELGKMEKNLIRTITKQKKMMICLNDGLSDHAEKSMKACEEAFHQILPKKSSFER